MFIEILLSCAVIAFLYYYIIHLDKYRRLINLIPGPPMIPILGDYMMLLQHTREDLLDLLLQRFKKYRPVWKSWYLTNATASISDPDDLQIILSSTKHIKKGMIYKLFHPWLKEGLLLSTGEKWQERRKILTPAFNSYMLKKFVKILVDESNHMIKSLKDMEVPIIEDLASFISFHALNIICETSMGTSLQSISESEQKQYRKAIHEMGIIIVYRFVRPWYYNNTLYSFTSKYKEQVNCLKILHRFTDEIIAERKRYHESTRGRYLNFENEEVDDVTNTRKKRLAMLDLLIAASINNKMSDLDIREEVDTFMFEGHDTVSMATVYVILLLAEHNDIQARVRNEINAVMKENGGELTMTALQNLPYLERCIKETLRLYPSVFFISRTLEHNLQLKSYLLPAGIDVHIDILNVHRNPDFWPNPDVFDPDRFLPELVRDRHPFAYVPFSAGSRNCIGQRFAMLELKAMVGTLVHNFYLESMISLSDVRCMVDLVLRVGRPLPVKFVPV